jgi:hypothetical protein
MPPGDRIEINRCRQIPELVYGARTVKCGERPVASVCSGLVFLTQPEETALARAFKKLGSRLSPAQRSAAQAGIFSVSLTAANAAGTSSPATLVLTIDGGGGSGNSPQTITFAPIANKTFGDPPFMLTATASSGLPISFAVLAGPAAVSGASITLTGVGPVTVRASQPGNGTFQAAVPVERAFNVLNPAGTTLSANGSIWYDVTGDGIRDEIVRANTPRFSVRISELDEPVEVAVNSNWYFGDLYNSDDSGGVQVYQGYRWFWLPYVNLNPWAVAEFDFEAEPGYVYTVFGETTLPNSNVGRYGDDVANWPKSHIGGPTMPHYPSEHTEQVGNRLIAREANYLASWLNCAYYLIRYGQAVAGIRINDPNGNAMIGNIPVGGATAYEFWVPDSGQITLQLFGVSNTALQGQVDQVAWKIFDLAGVVLREGFGLSVNLDGLPRGLLTLAVYQGTNPTPRPVVVRTSTLELEFQISSMATGKVVDPPPPPATTVRIGVIEGDSITFGVANSQTAASLPDSAFTWTGMSTGNGRAITVSCGQEGDYTQHLRVAAVGNRMARVAVRSLPLLSEASWLLINLDRVDSAVAIRNETEAWASANEGMLGGGVHNGRTDAARHAYLSALMTADWGVVDAEGLGSAHERSNYNNGAPHNECVMDLENNLRGRVIGGMHTTRGAIANAVVSALNAGLLTILDDTANSNGAGLLKPSAP